MRFFLVALFLTSFSPAFADSLWAVDTGLTGHLWTIDTTTGAATQGPALSAQIDGDISWLNGTLYGGFRSDAIGTQGFYSIDPATGVATLIDNSIRVPSLAAIPSLSEFYDVGAAVPGVDIITPTGAIAQHFAESATTDFVNDLAYDSLHGVLYAADTLGQLNTIDLSTGDATIVGRFFSGGGRPNGPIAYDWNTNILYMLFQDDLYSLNTNTGSATLIGLTGLTNVSFNGFADAPVPEPSTAAMIGLGLAGLALVRSRFR